MVSFALLAVVIVTIYARIILMISIIRLLVDMLIVYQTPTTLLLVAEAGISFRMDRFQLFPVVSEIFHLKRVQQLVAAGIIGLLENIVRLVVAGVIGWMAIATIPRFLVVKTIGYMPATMGSLQGGPHGYGIMAVLPGRIAIVLLWIRLLKISLLRVRRGALFL